MGWGSGSSEFSYLISPYEALQARARQDGTAFHWVFDDYNYPLIAKTAQQATVCFAFVKSDSGEGYITVDGNQGDRNNLTAWQAGDELIATVAGNCLSTIVVVHSVGQINMEAWADHPNVTAILWASLPGQESGNSLVDVVYGDVNPSGRLPFTIAKNDSDYSSKIIFPPNAGNDSPPFDDFPEGLLVDYRAFDAKNINPRYEFGFGLSYTTFNVSHIFFHANSSTQISSSHHWETFLMRQDHHHPLHHQNQANPTKYTAHPLVLNPSPDFCIHSSPRHPRQRHHQNRSQHPSHTPLQAVLQAEIHHYTMSYLRSL